MFLTELFTETKARGRHARVPHVSVWYDDVTGWRATCGGVFCDTDAAHGSPEEAVRSAFFNAEYMALRLSRAPPTRGVSDAFEHKEE